MKHKVNTVRTVIYVALNFQTGLTDLTLYVRKPDGSTLDPITMTEQGEGVYYATYTPDTVGIWQEKVSSATNGDKVIRSYEVVNYDENDIMRNVDDVEAKVDTLNTKADNLQNDVTYIKDKIDSIDQQINPGGYFA